MSGFVRLAQLKKAIRDLLLNDDGLDVIAIVDKFREDEQFPGSSYEQVQAFYNHLREEANAAKIDIEKQLEEYRRKIDELEPYLADHEEYLAEHEQLFAEREQELAVRRQKFQKHEERYYERANELEENDPMSDELCLQFEEEHLKPFEEHREQFQKYKQEFLEHLQEFSAYQEQIEDLRRKLARKQQKKFELEILSKRQQNPKSFLIYDETLVDPPALKCFWGGRFLVTVGDHDANTGTSSIGFYDMFQGKTKSFEIQRAGRICQIYALRDPYFLLEESIYRRSHNYLHLAKLDFESETLHVVQSREFRSFRRILVNESDSSKFLLWRRNDVDECKLVGNEIQLVKNFALGSDCFSGSYFDEEFCALKFEAQRNQFRNWKLTQFKMSCYDLERNENSTHDLKDTPDTLDCSSFMLLNFAWIRDTVFLPVELRLLNKHGVIYTNPRIRSWKLVEFGVIDSEICFLQSAGSENLLICAEKRKEGEPSERKVYKLQMRKPDLLRNMAWMAIVKLYKEAGAEDPYAEARQDLPLNSELQPFMLNYSSE